MFDRLTNSVRRGITSAGNFIETSTEKIKQMIHECIAESIPEEVRDIAVKPIQTTQIESEGIRTLNQDPSLENFQKLTEQLRGIYTREADRRSYSLIIQHLRGNTAEEKAANFRRLFKPRAEENGSVSFVFRPTHNEISECLTENNSDIRAACRNLQNATMYTAADSGNPTMIKTLVAIGYGTAELGAQLTAKLHQLGTVVAELLPEQENQQNQPGRGNNNER